MHPALLRIAEALPGTPFDQKVWLVGGAVRDELLGFPATTDFDLVTTEDAIALAEWLHQAKVSTIHPVTYPRFGTALIMVEGIQVELVTARSESYADGPRKPKVKPATLLDDALRRDFTVNALMRNLQTGELVDLLGTGRSDLENRILRTPLEPERTFRDDPLRMLRAVRFRRKLQFEPAPEMWAAIQHQATQLKQISAERIRDEFSKMIVHERASEALKDLLETGLLAQFAPDLVAMVGVEQGKWHHLDVWDHTRLVVSKVEPTLELRLAALLHDIAKPPTRTVDENGNTRFFTHEVVGKEMARKWLASMRYSSEMIDVVALLVKNHMRLGSGPTFTHSAARRLLRDLDGHEEELLNLVEADADSLKPGTKLLDLGPIRAKLEAVKRSTPRETLESPLSGQQIMVHLNLASGPAVGKIKARLTECVLEGTLAPDDQAGAYKLLDEWS
jgi:poly(A) polymerase